MKEHKRCNVLGKWCWDHQVKTEAGVPGWAKPSKGPGVGYSVWARNEVTMEGYTEAIVWANGDISSKRAGSQCAMCDKHCKYPVSRSINDNGDTYMIRNKSELKG